jgi:putative tricarboxylic transport membrane protein
VKADSVAGGVGFVFSLAYLAIALQITPSPSSAVLIGPRVFPIAIGVAFALASLALLAKGLREAPSDAGGEPAEPVEEEDDTLTQSPTLLGVIVALLFGYILLFIPLGYLISTALFILAVTMYLDSRHWIRNLVYAVLFPLVVYFVFTELLRVTLPGGLLG